MVWLSSTFKTSTRCRRSSNCLRKHTKPTPQAGVAGGIVEKEAPIQVSNVAIFNPETGKGDRVGFKVEGDTKVRIFKSNGEAIG